MTVQLYLPLSTAASSGLIMSSLTYGGVEFTALVMFIRGPLLSSVIFGPVHTIFTSSPSSTNWLRVVVQVSVRGVPAERVPLRLAESTTNGVGTEKQKPSFKLQPSKLTIMLTLNDDILNGVSSEIRDIY